MKGPLLQTMKANQLALICLLSHVDAFTTISPTKRSSGNIFSPLTHDTGRKQSHWNIWSKSSGSESNENEKRSKIRESMSSLAKRIVKKPIAAVAPQAIAEIITDATYNTVDMVLDEVNNANSRLEKLNFSDIIDKEAKMESDTMIALDTIALAKTTAADAFATAEFAIEETEEALKRSKLALAKCKEDVAKAIAIAEKSAYQANIASQKATALATSAAITASSSQTESEITASSTDIAETQIDDNTIDVSSLSYEDVDYQQSEMQPPFIGEDQCLVPGEAIVRVEKAKDNSRRIFAGIDIMASVDDIWNVRDFFIHLLFQFIVFHQLTKHSCNLRY